MAFKLDKRPFSEDESCQLSCKRSRQLDYSHLSSTEKVPPCSDILNKFRNSGQQNHKICQDGERLLSQTNQEMPVDINNKDIESGGAYGSISTLSWITGCKSEEESRSEPELHIPRSPGYFEHEWPSRPLVRYEDIYSSLVDLPPRKLVSVGPDYQVDVPVWGQCNSCFAADDSFNKENLMGTCVIPMPDTDLSSQTNDTDVGHGRTDCNCPDESSARCVRQHVMEAREKLRVTLGQERFVEVGFGDMGEGVAEKWSEEDEQVFHEVVFSNPASKGKNFWDLLPLVFPSKTKKDLVSYYFNVFKLRRRAEQNRLDPMNIDSDNDEWQGNEEIEAFGMTDEDEDEEDSGIESPVDQEAVIYRVDAHDTSEDHDSSDDDNASVGSGDELVHGLPGIQISRSPSSPAFKLVDSSKTTMDGSEDQDVLDDSCMSYESQHNMADSFGALDFGAKQESCVKTCQKPFHRDYGNDVLSDVIDHGFMLENCDTKVWDIGFLGAPRKEVDFLSTCNMIEEVFGDEACTNNCNKNNEPRSDPDFS